MTLEQESRRGEQARRLLEDPLLQEAFTAVDGALREAWAATTEEATDERERLWLMLKLLGRVRSHLAEIVETGRLAGGNADGFACSRSGAPHRRGGRPGYERDPFCRIRLGCTWGYGDRRFGGPLVVGGHRSDGGQLRPDLRQQPHRRRERILQRSGGGAGPGRGRPADIEVDQLLSALRGPRASHHLRPQPDRDPQWRHRLGRVQCFAKRNGGFVQPRTGQHRRQ